MILFKILLIFTLLFSMLIRLNKEFFEKNFLFYFLYLYMFYLIMFYLYNFNLLIYT